MAVMTLRGSAAFALAPETALQLSADFRFDAVSRIGGARYLDHGLTYPIHAVNRGLR
jgi:hypothetical protein